MCRYSVRNALKRAPRKGCNGPDPARVETTGLRQLQIHRPERGISLVTYLPTYRTSYLPPGYPGTLTGGTRVNARMVKFVRVPCWPWTGAAKGMGAFPYCAYWRMQRAHAKIRKAPQGPAAAAVARRRPPDGRDRAKRGVTTRGKDDGSGHD